MDDYNEDAVSEEQAPSTGIHLPIALIAGAISLFIFAQISNLGQNGASMKWQSENLSRQLASLNEGSKNLENLLGQRESLVQQSLQLQERYTALLSDIIDLAQTDADTKSIVEKYKIAKQQNSNTPAASTKP
jgi:hypothetical protein